MEWFTIKRLILFIFLWSPLQSFCQNNFMAGVARESLRPGKESISLALAGYGAPREGRFTLNWLKKERIDRDISLTGNLNDVLLAVNEKGQVLEAHNNFPLKWYLSAHSHDKVIGKHITGNKNNLYLLEDNGHIYIKSKLNKNAKWQKVEKASGMTEISVYRDNLYGVNSDGVFKKANVNSGNLKWSKFAHLPGTISFVIHHDLIYASTGLDTLWMLNIKNPDEGWIKVGYNNGEITNVQIKEIVLIKDKLYAVNEKNEIFEAVKNYGTKQEELFATALAIKKEKETVILLGLDLCGFDAELATEVKQELFRTRGIPASAVLINASHTHFAPVTQSWATWGPHNQSPNSNYMEIVVKPAILKAAQRALDNLKPSNIFFGRGKTDIGYNRSNGGNPEPYDDAVDVIKVESIEDNESFLMILAGCHPVFGTAGKSNYTISSNYPGYMRDVLESTNQNTSAMFIQGCGGDINPKDGDPEVTGMKLAIDVLQVLNNEMKLLQGDISFSLDTLKIPATPRDQKEIQAFKKENKEHKNVGAEKNVRWANLMLKHYEENTMPEHLPVYIQTIDIGNWKLVGLSREVVTEYSLGIKKIWPDKMVSVAGYCNDVSSYLPVARHIQTGVYEGYESFLWYGQPSAFPENIFDIIINHIKDGKYSKL